VPPLKDGFKREKIAGGEFLTLRVEGKVVPWDKVPFKDYEEEEGQFDALIKKLKELKLTVSVGLREGYLLVSLGKSNDHLARLGKGKALASRKELKPLARFADERLTSISYFSQTLNTTLAGSKKNLDGLTETARELLPFAPLSEKQRGQILKDVKDLVKDLKTLVPERGALLSFSFLSTRGLETYSHDWGKYADRDGSKPLPLLNHLGGNPLLAMIGRSRVSTDHYKMLVKWIKVGHGYFEEYAIPLLDEETQATYQKIFKEVKPLLKRLDEVTAKMLLPALADGQTGFVLDSKLKSRQWFDKLPESETPMPLLEPALLLGVSDAALLRKAFTEYRTLGNKLLAKIHDAAPDDVPELKIPTPKNKKVKAGALYYYLPPEAWGLDAQLALTAGLSEKVAVLTVSRKHAERLLTGTPLTVKGGPLSDPKRKLAQATYLNWEGMVDALAPWVEMAIREVPPRFLGQNEANGAEGILQQARTVFQVLKVLRSYASATYLENGAWVTHSEIVIRDLEK
jgi:hypothetical protein